MVYTLSSICSAYSRLWILYIGPALFQGKLETGILKWSPHQLNLPSFQLKWSPWCQNWSWSVTWGSPICKTCCRSSEITRTVMISQFHLLCNRGQRIPVLTPALLTRSWIRTCDFKRHPKLPPSEGESTTLLVSLSPTWGRQKTERPHKGPIPI